MRKLVLATLVLFPELVPLWAHAGVPPTLQPSLTLGESSVSAPAAALQGSPAATGAGAPFANSAAVPALPQPEARADADRLALALATGFAFAEPAPGFVDDTLAAARRGELAPALQRLDGWATRYPEQPRYGRDALVVAGWAGQHARVVAQWPALDRTDTPSYVLRAIGFSARSSGQGGVARAAYGRALARDPRDWEAHAGLALTYLAEGHAADGMAYLDALWQALADAQPREATLPVYRAGITLALAMNEKLRAVGAYDRLLAITPGDNAARQAQARLLLEAGAAPLAEERLALPVNHGVGWPAATARSVEQAAFGTRVRWARADLDTGDGPPRLQASDRVLAQDVLRLGLPDLPADGLQALADPPPALDQPFSLAAACDRLVGLVDAGRMQVAITLHQAIVRGSPAALPAYCVAAAANAYLAREQPAAAEALFREAIERERAAQRTPELEWQLGVVHALRDQGDLTAARHELDLLLGAPACGAAEPGAPAAAPTGRSTAPNPARLDCLTQHALLSIDENQPARAEQILQQLRLRAPANGGVRLAWAELLEARAHPAAARAELQALVTDEPAAVHARVALAENAIGRRQLAIARQEIAQVAAVDPDLGDLQRAQRDLATVGRPYLTLAAGLERGSSTANVNGGQALTVESRLYSAPVGDQVRAFVHGYAGIGDVPGGTVRRNRAGAGLDLRADQLDGEIELGKGDVGGAPVGLALALAWRCSDVWQLAATADSNTNLLPYAAYRNGVEGRRAGLRATATVDESRRFDVTAAHTGFTDGNGRTEAGVSWTERWIGAPSYQLATTLGLDASRNTLANASYFNPAQDHTLDFALRQEWQGWHNARSSFAQGLELDAGLYAQAGQGQGVLYGLRYEHLWQLGDRLSYRYGLGLQRRPYDGTQATRVFGFLDLNWIL